MDGGESEEGVQQRVTAFIEVAGGRGRRGGVRGGVHVEERAERGGPGAAVDGWPWPVADGRNLAPHAHTARHRVGEAGL
jgi:hypothetical protein